MPSFKSYLSYNEFERAVQRETRYIYNNETTDFLETVLATGTKRKKPLPADSLLWRAQLGHNCKEINQNEESHNVEYAYDIERMKPLNREAKEGRVNPKGIPFLYLSTDKETAMSEVRPWIGSLISVGQFRTLKDLVILDCSADTENSKKYYFTEPSNDIKESAVWSDINRAFSKPITPNDKVADYVPTQIIAELFKENGIDGIVHKSSLGAGHNLVLFDQSLAEPFICHLYQTKTVEFVFDKYGEPYSTNFYNS